MPTVEVTPTAAGTPSEGMDDFCFFAGKPPTDVKYTVIKPLKIGKGSYGGVTDIPPSLAAAAAKARGADAMIDYTGSQRFGLLPWRLVRPVVRGTAVKLAAPGSDLRGDGRQHPGQIMAGNKAPGQQQAK